MPLPLLAAPAVPPPKKNAAPPKETPAKKVPAPNPAALKRPKPAAPATAKKPPPPRAKRETFGWRPSPAFRSLQAKRQARGHAGAKLHRLSALRDTKSPISFDRSLSCDGQMAEWSIAHAWKACVLEIVPRVRIPLCPPVLYSLKYQPIKKSAQAEKLGNGKASPSVAPRKQPPPLFDRRQSLHCWSICQSPDRREG